MLKRTNSGPVESVVRVEAEIKKWGNSLALRVTGVMASLVQTLSWKERKVRKIITARQDEFRETRFRLLPLIGAVEFLEG